MAGLAVGERDVYGERLAACVMPEAAGSAAGSAGAALAALGVPERAHRLVAVLHLVELAVRHEEARRSTGDVDDRFYPAVTYLLDRELGRPRGLAASQSAGRAA